MSFPPRTPRISAVVIISLLLGIPGSFKAQNNKTQTSQQAADAQKKKPERPGSGRAIHQGSGKPEIFRGPTEGAEVSTRIP